MTDNDIIKALECCLNLDCKKSPMEICDPCPYFHEGNCTYLLKENALNLINRQKAEIERLEKQLDSKCDRCIARDRAEAIKEFAWRLKGFCTETTTDNINCPSVMVLSFADEIIDDLVKEMIGEQK